MTTARWGRRWCLAMEKLLLIFHIADAPVEPLQLLNELADVLELVILAGETDVRDLIKVAQARHDLLADNAAGDLALELAVQLILNLIHDPLLGILGDGPLAAGRGDAPKHVLAIEGNVGAVTLDDDEPGGIFDALIGRKPLVTLDALPPTAHDLAALAGAAIDHLVVVVLAEGADHGAQCI